MDNARALCERLEQAYSFECEAGPLRNCVEWQRLKELLGVASEAMDKTLREFDLSGKAAKLCRGADTR
jgi:hypothetical protein